LGFEKEIVKPWESGKLGFGFPRAVISIAFGLPLVESQLCVEAAAFALRLRKWTS
jgi:hypothetical protein